MNFKKAMRLAALILLIALACVLPVPITTYRKDNLPKHLIENVDIKEEDDKENDLELFS
ncbi:hypothetical protein RM697_11665 [Ichthyenterobacterium sp. W332]|uniref:Uncharacterized protein n=1 Tax=Microcosmobacter mediterraneus TaxID=3075607 RepID=A0ABU2YMC3_9FLAO|nr:hypothetical protein [Ichthyenterobacterium sp. W332]MDT0559312.1 hypothetical protein [Ichthyenterobacterium sp. W332]